jgi:hypothetical protein
MWICEAYPKQVQFPNVLCRFLPEWGVLDPTFLPFKIGFVDPACLECN